MGQETSELGLRYNINGVLGSHNKGVFLKIVWNMLSYTETNSNQCVESHKHRVHGFASVVRFTLKTVRQMEAK